MSTDVQTFISDLDGGVLEKKLSEILSNVAGAVIEHGKAGKVALELKFTQIGNSQQVQVEHTLKYVQPTKRGKMAEDNATITPMHVGKRGALSFFPEDQGQLFTKTGEPNPPGVPGASVTSIKQKEAH
jgi:hypothetical protein